jgi:hypothetical protein
MLKSLIGIGVVLVGASALMAQVKKKDVVVVTDVRGEIVRVDPDKNIVVIKTGTGDAVKEVEYRVVPTTRYWETNTVVIKDGLRYRGFRAGAPIWYRVGTGDNASVFTEVRFYDPTLIKAKP